MKNEIPKKLLSLAEANYFCNVRQFIGLGENRTVNNLQAGMVKRDFETVGEWFSSLDDAGKAKIIRFLEAEWQQKEATRRFFADPYKKNYDSLSKTARQNQKSGTVFTYFPVES